MFEMENSFLVFFDPQNVKKIVTDYDSHNSLHTSYKLWVT